MKKILNTVAQVIFDKKGMNITAIDIEGISTLSDFMIIAQGTVDRHVKAIGNAIVDKMEEEGLYPHITEGLQEGDWVVLDYGDFIVHIFTPEMRERYRLEEVWKKGKIVDLDIVTERVS